MDTKCIKCGKYHDPRNECPKGNSGAVPFLANPELETTFFDLKPKYCTCPRESAASGSGGLRPGDILYFAADCPVHGKKQPGRQ